MSIAYQVKPTIEKKKEISELLSDYWRNDIWDTRDSFFDGFCPATRGNRNKKIDFSVFSLSIRDEIKYIFVHKLQEREIKINTLVLYGWALNKFAEFLKRYYPQLTSLVDIPYDKAMLQWRSFLVDNGIKVNDAGEISTELYRNLLKQLYIFFLNLYDTRDEYEKDIWDCRKVQQVNMFTPSSSTGYILDFTDIPFEFREVAKRYIKFRSTNNSYGQCYTDIRAIRLFTNYIHTKEPLWKDLRALTRKHMEDYLSWYKKYTKGFKASHIKYLICLRAFLDYMQRAMYHEAPELPSGCLIFNEDIPRKALRTENDIKYIPEGVLKQLEDNLEYLTPSECIPIVILLRASGWRISDILNLRYDSCLDYTLQGWYLCGDINKTQVLNHRVPVTDEVAAVIKSVIAKTKEKSTPDNNPNNLLFVRFEGKRKGRCPAGTLIQNALNRLARKQNITNDQGNIYHFGNHAFRHTKGVELINNGMQLIHVQKWMAHASPEMTIHYAKILDTTMRKSWEEATKQGLFRIDETGKMKKVDISDIQDEDIIEWEYIRHNLDAVRMPLGYCMKPKKQECYTQLNPCLTCRNLCTTPEFISQFEVEINETKALIERGKAQGRTVWVEKNQSLLERYEAILAMLRDGKIYHKAGKKGREYTGEERINGR